MTTLKLQQIQLVYINLPDTEALGDMHLNTGNSPALYSKSVIGKDSSLLRKCNPVRIILKLLLTDVINKLYCGLHQTSRDKENGKN